MNISQKGNNVKNIKLNIVDYIIIFALIVVVCGIGYKLFAPKVQESIAPTMHMTSTMRIRGAMPVLLDELAKRPEILTGQKLVAGNGYVDATVTGFETTTYDIQLETVYGEIYEATDPVRKDIIITVEADVRDTPVIKVANQEIRVGRTFILKTQRFEGTPTIETVVLE